jgi:hypothetical protein
MSLPEVIHDERLGSFEFFSTLLVQRTELIREWFGENDLVVVGPMFGQLVRCGFAEHVPVSMVHGGEPVSDQLGVVRVVGLSALLYYPIDLIDARREELVFFPFHGVVKGVGRNDSDARRGGRPGRFQGWFGRKAPDFGKFEATSDSSHMSFARAIVSPIVVLFPKGVSPPYILLYIRVTGGLLQLH